MVPSLVLGITAAIRETSMNSPVNSTFMNDGDIRPGTFAAAAAFGLLSSLLYGVIFFVTKVCDRMDTF